MIAAGQTQAVLLADSWVNPKPWWPDTPDLYRLRTTVVVNGQPDDIQETLFGFREWRREGTQFTLNGWSGTCGLISLASTSRRKNGWLPTSERTSAPPA